MSAYSLPREQLLASLRHYTTVLEEKKQALTKLSRTSDMMRNTLMSSEDADITSVLESREQDCKLLSHVINKHSIDVDTLIKVAAQYANNPDDETSMLARSLLSINDDSKSLAENILNCQYECEALLKTRLEAVSLAIKESSKKRKLNAAYGPAIRQTRPIYLDKQQ